MSRATFQLSFPQLERNVSCRDGDSIFEAARRNGVRIVGACGGRGTCGSCMVQLRSGTAVNGSVTVAGGSVETEPVAASGQKWMRACQVRARSDCEIEIAARSLAPVTRSEVGGDDSDTVVAEPAVTAVDIEVAEPTLRDPAADLDRVLAVLPPMAPDSDLMAVRALPAQLRDWNWRARVLIRRPEGGRLPEVVGFAPPGRPLLGLAVDLGTTNAAGFLIDLVTGKQLARLGIENPQAAWGADLISRINYAIKVPGGAEELQERAVAAINALADDLCHATGAKAADIADVALCGNTAMHHLLLGLPVRQLGRAPFVAALRDAIDVKARDLGLNIAPGGSVHFAANIGGFVGGDHLAALLATRERWSGVPVSLIMDIGTNTEISLVSSGTIISASCPSGPALEGGHIACGMRAADGAIEHVDAVDGRLRSRVIGGKTPVGICGSGVLDVVAALRELSLVNDGGSLDCGHPDLDVVDGKRAAVLAPDVVFTQADIRAVQLAKAAIRTGVDLLLAEAGLSETDITRFIIAGAFGSFIRVESAVAVGLLPNLPRARFEQVGNAAGAGVRQLLRSMPTRVEARQLARRCRYIELSTRADFQKTFMHNIGFKMKEGRRCA